MQSLLWFSTSKASLTAAHIPLRSVDISPSSGYIPAVQNVSLQCHPELQVFLLCLIGNFVYNAATSHLPEHFPLTQMIGLYNNQSSSLLLCHIFARRLYIARMVNWEQREKNISTKQMKIPSVLKSILY